jgi:hypothetical protein
LKGKDALAASGDSFGYHNLAWGPLMAVSGLRPWRLVNTQQCTDPLPLTTKNYLVQNVSTADVEKTEW